MSTHDWQKSSYSGDAANCVELRWQKSSHSGQAGNCVELRQQIPAPALHLRESDDPENILSTTNARLDALLRAVKDRRLA
jgi:uncharacterized protein DUF397